jgi:hypothetical protein
LAVYPVMEYLVATRSSWRINDDGRSNDADDWARH